MKRSNQFLMALGFIIIIGMCSTNFILKNEFLKIDLTDPYKNYSSVTSGPYSVLDISGSNGYPIEITSKNTEDLKVLRSRLGHFKSKIKSDTLFIEFTGSNISTAQRGNADTPPAIIIEKKELSGIVFTNTYNRITGFNHREMMVTLKGNAYVEISNVDLVAMTVDMRNTSQIEFLDRNNVDSLTISMANKTVARLQVLDFISIHQSLGDSVAMVLSKDTFNRIVE